MKKEYASTKELKAAMSHGSLTDGDVLCTHDYTRIYDTLNIASGYSVLFDSPVVKLAFDCQDNGGWTLTVTYNINGQDKEMAFDNDGCVYSD